LNSYLEVVDELSDGLLTADLKAIPQSKRLVEILDINKKYEYNVLKVFLFNFDT